MITNHFKEVLFYFSLSSLELKKALSIKQNNGVLYYGRDSEDEGTSDPEKTLMMLYASAADVIGSKKNTQSIINELLWLTELSLAFYEQAPYLWKLDESGQESYWNLARRLATAVLDSEGINICSPTCSFAELLEYYGFSIERT
jgi:hypothetical protein